MTMTIALLGPVPDAVTKALLANGYFDLRPAGVAVTGYFTTSIAGVPLFGFGTENSSIAGWGVGAWLTPIAPTVTSPSIHGDFVSRTVSE